MTWFATSVLAGLALVSATAGRAAAQDDLQAKLDAKLAEAWVKDGGWIRDYDRARETAKKSGKLITAYFTRSYAP